MLRRENYCLGGGRAQEGCGRLALERVNPGGGTYDRRGVVWGERRSRRVGCVVCTTDSSNAADKTPQDENANNIQVIYSTLQRGRYPDIKVQTGVPIKWIINAPKGSLNG